MMGWDAENNVETETREESTRDETEKHISEKPPIYLPSHSFLFAEVPQFFKLIIRCNMCQKEKRTAL